MGDLWHHINANGALMEQFLEGSFPLKAAMVKLTQKIKLVFVTPLIWVNVPISFNEMFHFICILFEETKSWQSSAIND